MWPSKYWEKTCKKPGIPSFRAVFLASHKSLDVKFFSAVGSTVGFVRSRMLSSMKIERAFKKNQDCLVRCLQRASLFFTKQSLWRNLLVSSVNLMWKKKKAFQNTQTTNSGHQARNAENRECGWKQWEKSDQWASGNHWLHVCVRMPRSGGEWRETKQHWLVVCRHHRRRQLTGTRRRS